MKTRIADLTGVALDWAAAIALGMQQQDHWLIDSSGDGYLLLPYFDGMSRLWRPSEIWGQGGPIIDKMDLLLERVDPETEPDNQMRYHCSAFSLVAGMNHPCIQNGPTALIAAMRCYVASEMGDEVEVPDELCGEST